MNKNTGGPAYPQGKTFVAGSQYVDMGTHGGMTLRDHFAGLVIQGLISAGLVHESYNKLAENSYKIADAMLAERGKEDGK